MDDDFNTSNVITYLLDLVKELNIALRNKDTQISQLYDKILLVSDVLGLKYDLKLLTKEENEIYKKWEEARTNKDFDKADNLRKILIERKIL